MASKWNLDKAFERFKAMKSDVPKVLGNQSVRFFQDSFKKQGFEDTGVNKWKPSKRVLTRGGTTLVQSGRLRRSIRIKEANFNRIVVGSYGLDYAQIHNEGLKSNQKVRSYTRRDGSVVKGFTRRMNMPKRQFMGISRSLMNRHRKTIETAINECFK